MKLILFFLLGFATLAAPPTSVSEVLDRYCIDCHDGVEAEGGFDLAGLGFDLRDEEIARRWILVHDRLQAGEMPPPKKRQPKAADKRVVLAALAKEIRAAELARADVVLRRLNRAEYENTVRELFGIDVGIDGLPQDTPPDGFDNVGEGLAVSAEAMQAYLEAADQVLDAVFGPAKKPKYVRHETNLLKQVDWKGRPQLASQIGKMFRETEDGLVIFQSGYCPTNLVNFARLKMPPGTYRGSIRARAVQSDKPVTLRVYGGDTIVNRRERHLVGYWDVPPDEWITIHFEDRLMEPGGTYQPKCYNTEDTRKNADTYPNPGIEIGDIVIEGPLDVWPPPSRARLLGDRDDAETIFHRLLPLAFRRPTAAAEAQPYLTLFKSARESGRDFQSALRVSLKAVLCSPEFLFLDEPNHRLRGDALAARLSYFLWSSMPDAELQSLARSGKLANSATLRNQVERMLKDEKGTAFTENFTGQWLDLREINFTEPDANLYPEFDELLRISMLRETELFFQEILAQDLSVTTFVDSDFTFLNERLARHYQIPGVIGQEFRRVSLPAGSVRGGVLTQASILKVTANGTYSSPVLRGAWVLEHILGEPTSPPPDNVAAIEPDIRGTKTIREQLAKHRDVKACAACHNHIDPPGFALECFDPIGGWRERYRSMAEDAPRPDLKRAPFTWAWVRYRIGPKVDASGHMPGGAEFADVRGFKKLLAADREALAANLARKLLTYGLGRKVGFSDRAAVDAVVRQSREADYGLRSLLHAVIQSEAFRIP